MGIISVFANAFRLGGVSSPAYEAAGAGRRLRGFQPGKAHVNVNIAKAGATLVARARWLYENDGFAGNAVDEWTSAVAGDGIKPRPRITDKALKRKLLDLWWRWTEEADAEGLTDFYGLQEKVVREVYLTGECFVRRRARRVDDMRTVPFQLQVLPSEMLDVTFDLALAGSGFIRAGIEFDGIGRRVAYHFWRNHPYDRAPGYIAGQFDRIRVPASEVLHVYDGRQSGQLRGVPRVARVLVKLFTLEVYDDAELERKKTAALFAGFRIGRGDNPVNLNEDVDSDLEDDQLPGIMPGAMVDLGDDSDIKFSQPVDVGGSYEPFQYRNLLKICAGLGVPYAVVTGDVTRGNFSNVRTALLQFRRRVSQYQNNTIVFQLCRPVWNWFIDMVEATDEVALPGFADDPTIYYACDHLMPRFGWVDPLKDMQAEALAVEKRFKSRGKVVAEMGYDREEQDLEIAAEIADEKRLGISPVASSARPSKPAPFDPDDDDSQSDGPEKKPEDDDEEATE